MEIVKPTVENDGEAEGTCTAVWDAGRPQCTGWNPHGHPLHGCGKPLGHGRGRKAARFGRVHECPCGDTCTKPKPNPRHSAGGRG